MTRIGYQASRLHGVGKIEALASALADGAGLFEIFLDRERPDETPAAERDELRRASHAAGICLQVHGSYGIPDPLGRPPLVEQIEFCRAIGADRLTVHLDDMQRAGHAAIDWEFLTRAGVWIGIENVTAIGAREPDELLSWLEPVPAAAPVGITFDVGHANIAGRTPLEWLETANAGLGRLGRRIVSVHLHDNDGSSDAHRPIGEGTIDFARLIPALIEAGADRFVIEHWASRHLSLGRLHPLLSNVRGRVSS